MKSTYYDYLRSLTKEQLIDLIYKPYKKRGEYPAISKRKVALRLSYHGENYKGVQHYKHLKSVHDCLQNALKVSGIGDGIVFCGRTDAGVSAINMVVSVEVNSRLENPNRSYQIIESDHEEYPYDVALNMLLPDDIRITGWAPVPDNFNARYDCIQRHYKYFFALGSLDLKKMEEAVEKICQMDDFYHLSTHSNPKAIYKRKISEIKIHKVSMQTSLVKMGLTNNAGGNSFSLDDDLYSLDIKAGGFLHNMVRKIFWVVQRCGKGNPFTLKNVEIADSTPLVFVGAKYREDLNFLGNRYSEVQFQREASIAKIRAAVSQLRLDTYKLK
ncbi:tRNA pseudouridine synthase A [Vittaforma corneae ATCC 50505]|uniref:tRNA pseudouridine synthase n=1 Tax=Vittaforma corneae (strain ATCC 50505) TaxID=993615 RepID=L2GLM3_VITCO|nr:tRNA pseudouridine synthase A [Vittaforma corneae ATCC 50505]ELA41788.1 tRNA pseudouridine synthase A [Vittaforma corneae ATCC 50505]